MNREYLQRQLTVTQDPAVAEKIQSMMAFEIEKSMLVNYQAFEVFAKPVVPYQRTKPKRKFLVILSFMLGAVGTSAAVLAWKWWKDAGPRLLDALNS